MILDGYQFVSFTKYCGHVKGGFPYGCSKMIAGGCQNLCTTFNWCVGYSYDGNRNCALMSSSRSCPEGWKANDGAIATSFHDFVVPIYSNAGGYSCYVKGTL